MSGRILIIDSVATNRIVLKVKLVAAQYAVENCANCTEAAALIAANRPDLVLVNLADPTEDRHAFCRNLRDRRETTDIAIVAVGVADTGPARFAALDAGCDEVLPRPISDALMLARVRSLIRRNNAIQEWQLRDGTRRALGFDEDAAPRLTPARVRVLSDRVDFAATRCEQLRNGLTRTLASVSAAKAIPATNETVACDLLVLDGAVDASDQSALFRLVADLRARAESCLSVQLVLVPPGRHDLAAMLLDLGADDVAFNDLTAPELTLRAVALLRRKVRQDSLRDRVRNGLNAAVTDPLTNLFNRRYAEVHLKRIAEHAQATGAQYALMILDIDHFKSINDRFGHASGDKVLQEIATRLQANFRAIDLIARIGGEEFLIAMPGTNLRDAEETAERVRQLIGRTPFALGSGQKDLAVTVSVGVAVDGLDQKRAKTSEQMFHSADAALYVAKSAGRNAVSIARTAA